MGRRLLLIPTQTLKELYWGKHLSTYKIAQIYHCHSTQIRKLLLDSKIKLRSQSDAIILDRGIKIKKQELSKLYLGKDLSIYQIASILKCHPSTVARKLKQFSISIKPPKEQVYINKNDLKTLYIEKGYSTYQLAKIFKCSVKTIRNKMIKHNIPRRSIKKVFISKKTLQKMYINERLSLKKIGKMYKLTPSGTLKRMRKYNIPMRNSWDTNTIYPKKQFNGTLKEKSYLIGFRIGDLGVRRKSTRTGNILIGCNTTKQEQVTLIKNLFSKYSHVWVSPSNSKGVIYTSVLLDHSFTFLLPKANRVYQWIKNNPQYFLAFIAGYTDAEGSIGVYTNRARFRVGSYDVGILKDITKWLNKKKINANLILETPRGPKQNGDFWRISVNEAKSLITLFRLLSPYLKHAKRKKDISCAINNINTRLRNGTIQP